MPNYEWSDRAISFLSVGLKGLIIFPILQLKKFLVTDVGKMRGQWARGLVILYSLALVVGLFVWQQLQNYSNDQDRSSTFAVGAGGTIRFTGGKYSPFKKKKIYESLFWLQQDVLAFKNSQNCQCECECPDISDTKCMCDCECPRPGSSCGPGFTQVCPSADGTCPEDYYPLCPEDLTAAGRADLPELEDRVILIYSCHSVYLVILGCILCQLWF